MIDGVMRDVRYGFRTLRRDSGLTVFAVLIVGLGIGLASTVFNVFNALLIRPLPFDDPSRLVWIANGTSENLSTQTVQVLNLQALRDQRRVVRRRRRHSLRSTATATSASPATESRNASPACPSPRTSCRSSASARTSADSSPPRSALWSGEDGRSQPWLLAAPLRRRSGRHRPLDRARRVTRDRRRRAAGELRLRVHLLARRPRRSVRPVSVESRDQSPG